MWCWSCLGVADGTPGAVADLGTDGVDAVGDVVEELVLIIELSVHLEGHRLHASDRSCE